VCARARAFVGARAQVFGWHFGNGRKGIQQHTSSSRAVLTASGTKALLPAEAEAQRVLDNALNRARAMFLVLSTQVNGARCVSPTRVSRACCVRCRALTTCGCLGRQGTIVFVSDACLPLLGYSPDDIVGSANDEYVFESSKVP
jgi:PAS domain-containing protein